MIASGKHPVVTYSCAQRKNEPRTERATDLNRRKKKQSVSTATEAKATDATRKGSDEWPETKHRVRDRMQPAGGVLVERASRVMDRAPRSTQSVTIDQSVRRLSPGGDDSQARRRSERSNPVRSIRSDIDGTARCSSSAPQGGWSNSRRSRNGRMPCAPGQGI